MKKSTSAVHWGLGLLLVLGFAACVLAALHDGKVPRRGSLLILPRP